MQALDSHVKKYAPEGARVTFTTLGFKAFPYSMPKDTIINRAASKVSNTFSRLCVSHAALNLPVRRSGPHKAEFEASLQCVDLLINSSR